MGISSFLQAISQGFQKSQTYVLAALSILIAFLVFLIIMTIIITRRQRAKTRKSALRRYEERIRQLDLTINEIDFVEDLAGCLDKPWKKYLLVTNENTFLNCCEKMNTSRPDFSHALMERVGVKAGFIAAVPTDEKPEKGTRSLQPGIPVKLEFPNGGLYSARVVENRGKSFLLESPRLPEDIKPGPVVVHVPHRTGLLAFATESLGSVQEGKIELRHSIEPPSQRWGELGRKDKEFTVYLKIDGSDGPPEKTILYRMGRRGAYLENPRGMVSKHDDVRIFFSHSGKPGGVWVNGEVQAVSMNGTEIFVKFSHLRK